ncbi:TerC family protein [Ammoniphilus resinae]|uniref:YjbE family integral membrane protein n=1 Tax=Ammoniphilus resinae TaxID=861532 RepID=A0ABS4GRX0_9BACL|nr:TerC family protein [Ammoniphilus resinae]MBP1932877.1 YjbE family integral membrane protein [Ammoniphilus resinae]
MSLDLEFYLAFINIIIIDLVLSGDNAVVVGMASRKLPPKQRKQAILWGTLGAVILRIFLTGMATWLMAVPYIKIVGGILLVWISIKLLIQQEEHSSIPSGKNIWEAVKIIIVADFVMSLDNVLAIGGAAKGNLFLVVFGLALSVPLLMWGSSIVATWMNEYPILIYFGSGVLSFTALTMVLEDSMVQGMMQNIKIVPYWDTILPLIITAIILFAGKIWRTNMFTIYRVK